MKKHPLEKHACDFKNETECDEELDEEGLSMGELDRDKFDDE